MINTIEAYIECGKKAAKALNNKDANTYDFERRWYRQAFLMEDPQGKIAASEAYDKAFKETRNVPTQSLFK